MKKWAIVYDDGDEECDILETFLTEDEAAAAAYDYDGNISIKEVDEDYPIEEFEEDWKNGYFEDRAIARKLWDSLNEEEKEKFIEEVVPYLV